MTRKSLFHFALVGVLWGIPYLLMKVAVEDFPPAAVVASRTLIGASILIPIAIYRKKFGGAVLGFKYVAFYALMEMIGPWILITTAEQKINTGLAGLLVSTVPILPPSSLHFVVIIQCGSSSESLESSLDLSV